MWEAMATLMQSIICMPHLTDLAPVALTALRTAWRSRPACKDIVDAVNTGGLLAQSQVRVWRLKI